MLKFIPLQQLYKIKPFYWILFITLLASALRLYKLDYQSLWHDELISMSNVDPDKTFSQIIELSRNDQPPAFFMLLHLWFKVFPFTEFYGRLLTALIGIAGVPAMFFLGKEIKNTTTGVLASLLTSVNFFHLSYSQDVRFYSLLFLVSTLSFLFYLKCIKYGKPSHFIWYSFFTSLTLYTHYYGLVLFASQGLIFLSIILIYTKDKKFIAYSIGSGVVVLILISPWIPQFFKDSETSEFWITMEKFPRFLVAYFYQYLKDKLSFYVGGILIFYFIFQITRDAWREKKFFSVELFVLFLWLILGYGIPYLYSVLKVPLLISRYTMIVLPAVLVLFSLAIEHLGKRYLIIGLSTVIALSSLRSLFYIQEYYTSKRNEEYREAAKITTLENRNIYIFSYHSQLFNYYFKAYGYSNYSHIPWEVDYVSEIGKRDTIWVLSAGDNVWEPLKKELHLKHFVIEKEYVFDRTKAQVFVRKEPATQIKDSSK